MAVALRPVVKSVSLHMQVSMLLNSENFIHEFSLYKIFVIVYAQFYSDNVKQIRTLLATFKTSLPLYKDMQWRLDVQVFGENTQTHNMFSHSLTVTSNTRVICSMGDWML